MTALFALGAFGIVVLTATFATVATLAWNERRKDTYAWFDRYEEPEPPPSSPRPFDQDID